MVLVSSLLITADYRNCPLVESNYTHHFWTTDYMPLQAYALLSTRERSHGLDQKRWSSLAEAVDIPVSELVILLYIVMLPQPGATARKLRVCVDQV